MLKKRLIGVVTVRQGWAVQSFEYQRYLPLGRPEALIENLDRWGADEILVQCIDRSAIQEGPNLKLLKRIGALGLSTPLIYGGGIRDAEDAVKAVSMGADRILVDSMLWDVPQKLQDISRELGTQALIANLTVRVHENALLWRNYRSYQEISLKGDVLADINLEWVSEVMLTDWLHEGIPGGFDPRIPELYKPADKPILVFGGLSECSQIRHILAHSNVAAACVGNFLNYKEHAVQEIKRDTGEGLFRPAEYLQGGY